MVSFVEVRQSPGSESVDIFNINGLTIRMWGNRAYGHGSAGTGTCGFFKEALNYNLQYKDRACQYNPEACWAESWSCTYKVIDSMVDVAGQPYGGTFVFDMEVGLSVDSPAQMTKSEVLNGFNSIAKDFHPSTFCHQRKDSACALADLSISGTLISPGY